jgi:outer membrane protein, heavy metal efflux system
MLMRFRVPSRCSALVLLLVAGCKTSSVVSTCTPAASKPLLACNCSPSSAAAADCVDPQPHEARQVAFREPVIEQIPATAPGEVPARLVSAEVRAVEDQPGMIPLSLDASIAIALDRNPALVAQRASEPTALAVTGVAATYPFNPFVQVQVLPYTQEQSGKNLAVNHYVWLMQTLELAHQRRHRETSAAANLNQVRWNIIQSELVTLAQTQRLFFAALYQKELYDLAQRTAALNEQLLGVVQRRFAAGVSPVAELTTARVAARQSRRQAELAHTTLQTALLALERQLNQPPSGRVVLEGRLHDFVWLPVGQEAAGAHRPSMEADSPQVMLDDLAMGRPDVMAAAAATDVARANANLAWANTVQNVAAGPFYERDESGTILVGLRGHMNLPVWDSGRPLARQRDAEFQQVMVALQQARERAIVEAQTAWDRYERARRLVMRERDEFLTAIPQELKKIQDQFAAGQADILYVFAAQNGLLQEERTYLDLLNEVAQASAELAQATGLPPARLVRLGPPAAGRQSEQLPTPAIPPP